MYSSNPKDWYFEVMPCEHDSNMLYLALSQDKECLDDGLTSDELPLEIVNLLKPLGVYTEAEVEESVFEVLTSDTIDELKDKLIALGFNYNKFTPD